jgi:hypothetical protein
MEIPRLSALTDATVDHLYGIDRATPTDHPVFLFLVGAPGAGKSSGHAAAIEAGLLPADRTYVTINLDLLLEAITPFRAASSLAHLLKHDHRDHVHFGSISAYGSRKENLGLFKWYDEAHTDLIKADPVTIAALNAVREVYQPLADATASNTISEQSEAALARAVAARLPIVYETTFSLGSSGRVTKVDVLMRRLAKTPYRDRIYMWHITGAPTEIADRVRARQEYIMPADEHPYYRYVPTGLTRKFVEDTATAFARLKTQYAGKIQFHEISIPHDPRLLPTAPAHNLATQRDRVIAAYAPRRLSRSWRVSTPRGSMYVSSATPTPVSEPSPEPVRSRRATTRKAVATEGTRRSTRKTTAKAP